jgi:hypothetical protein
MNTETITYYNYFDVNLPNASATYTLLGDNTIQTMTNKTLTAPTINNGTITSATINSSTLASPSITTAFTLFSNPFNYVPWTSIQTWDGGAYGTSPLLPVLLGGASPSTSATTIIRYIYSIIGKSLYINYYFFQPNNTGTSGGSGNYYYKFPTGYTATSAVSSSIVSWGTGSGTSTYGSRFGTAQMNTSGTAQAVGSIYYTSISSVNYLVLNREQGTTAPHSSTNFQYSIAGVTTFAFECCIPLA